MGQAWKVLTAELETQTIVMTCVPHLNHCRKEEDMVAPICKSLDVVEWCSIPRSARGFTPRVP